MNEDGTVLKLNDLCPSIKYESQKQVTLTLKRFQLERAGVKIKFKKSIKRTQTVWNIFLQPAVNLAAPFSRLAVRAKSKNPQVAQATTNLLESISGGKILSLTDLHEYGFRLRVLRFYFRKFGNIMSSCIKVLFDYELVKKCSRYEVICLKTNFHKDKNRKDDFSIKANHVGISNKKNASLEIGMRKKDYNAENPDKIKNCQIDEKMRRRELNFNLAHNLRVRTNQTFKAQNA